MTSRCFGSGWTEPKRDEQVITGTGAVHEAMTPFANGGVYSKYLDRDDVDRVEAALGDNNQRLLRVKDAYDLENLFSPSPAPV